MSASTIDVITFYISHDNIEDSSPLTSNLSFEFPINQGIQTLSTTGTDPGMPNQGLLYTPDLDPTESSGCYNASLPYAPQNVTRLADLPPMGERLIAIAPWLSPQCTLAYLASANRWNTYGFLFFLPNTGGYPPDPTNQVWNLGDGGQWQKSNNYGVYAVSNDVANIILHQSALYNQNITNVPNGETLLQQHGNHTDAYVRLFVDIETVASSSSLPSLWVFLLIVLGVLLAIIGAAAGIMQFLHRRRTQSLRRRVMNGEVDLEVLGIKRMTVPQEVLDEMPVYIYGAGPCLPSEQTNADIARAGTATPEDNTPSNGPVERTSSYNPSALQQPNCAICIDDFVTATAEAPGSTVRELPCHHIFHPECVDTFLKENSSLCPLCKKTALPSGYCPKVITGGMVRRERLIRRMREGRIDGPTVLAHLYAIERVERGESEPSIGTRIRNLSGLSLLRRNHQQTETSASPGVVEMDQVATSQSAQSNDIPASSHQATSGHRPPAQGRREWARQRAVAMLGRTAPEDPDADEARTTSRWRKVLRGVFPT
ncbi:Hypothetical protein R9X50_00780100 [Acrodontium crateriforme]|uniref:RING-type domain-containing protein n=1 Tax=Acrodontium crateriforme TaxID=150365 RepID=A0AAQ3RB11_9PEZI|nr:Hypothetical protein R9X50_00780100 [Acrodontium crateriforme]